MVQHVTAVPTLSGQLICLWSHICFPATSTSIDRVIYVDLPSALVIRCGQSYSLNWRFYFGRPSAHASRWGQQCSLIRRSIFALPSVHACRRGQQYSLDWRIYLCLQLVLAMAFEYDFQVDGHSELRTTWQWHIRLLRSIAQCSRSWDIDGRLSTW